MLDIKHKALKQFYQGNVKGLPAKYHARIRLILAALEAATLPEHMDLPGFRLHPLKGDLKGYWAVTVGAIWRIIFRFDDNEATDIDYLDYH